MKWQILISPLVLLAVAGFASAAILSVPTTYPTIQAAINDANDDDVVIVDPNTYIGPGNKDIDFLGKAITVRSVDPNDPNVVAATIIDCEYDRGGFYFHSGEDANSKVEGFTITNGDTTYGGGIECDGASPTISNCIITRNHASNFGGGIDLYMSSAVITNCVINDNSATKEGGGINCDSDVAVPPTISFCRITDNRFTNIGAGINCYESSATIKNCIIAGNTAVYEGGAVYLWDSGPKISNCTIVNNNGLADLGGIYREGSGGAPTIVNSILWNNGDDLYNCVGFVEYCCIEDNDPGLCNIHFDPLFRTGPLGDYYLSQEDANQVVTSHCVDAGNANADDPNIGLDAYTTRTDNGLDAGTVDIGYHYPDSGFVVNYDLITSVVDPNTGSIDPCHPDPGSPYIQFAEVVLTADPCDGYRVKAWTGTDNDTSTANTNVVTMDANETVTVEFEVLPMWILTTSAGTHGKIKPRRGGTYPDGTVVTLTAIPDSGYRVQAWSGTDDDGSIDTINYVTMNNNKAVGVSFVKYTPRHVPGEYPTIQDGIDAANPGDVVIIAPGTYISSNCNGFVVNKNITVTGSDANKPNLTIIDCAGEQSAGFTLSSSGTCVLNGVSIINAYRSWVPAADGQDFGASGGHGTSSLGGGGINISGDHMVCNCIIRDCTLVGGLAGDGAAGDPNGYPGTPEPDAVIDNGGNGGNGGGARGAGIYISSGSPLIKNCTIDGCTTIGGDGGDGGDGCDAIPDDPNASGGYGGSGGKAGTVLGAGVYCGTGTSPTFENCTIINSRAISGVAGDGGVGGDDAFGSGSGRGGHGGVPGEVRGAGVYCRDQSRVTFTNCNISGNQAYGGYGGNGGDAGVVEPDDPVFGGGLGGLVELQYADSQSPQGNVGPESYTSDGGGMYCAADSNVVFIDCTLGDNVSRGSVSGRGGWPSRGLQNHPRKNTRIASFGAGVYCAEDSNSIFAGCTIQGNRTTHDPDQYPDDPYDPSGDYAGDDYTGYGGGVCFDGIAGTDWAYTEFNDCHIAENSAPIGGGIYGCGLGDLWVDDCNFVDNSSYLGGGLFSIDSLAVISGCNISGNVADAAIDSNDPAGDGGGLYCFASVAVVLDCVITENGAGSSGGGVYMAGEPDPDLFVGTVGLYNCLITNNTSGGGGGGVSCGWYVEPIISNCTIADNAVVGVSAYGGGLYCWCGTYATVIDSILWGNVGAEGSQIAVSGGGSCCPLPATTTLNITYSDIGPPETPPDPNLELEPTLIISTTGDANTLANEILGVGITASNFSYTGDASASGIFKGGLAAGIGIESGIILTSGNANLALPPNTSDAATGNNGLEGDADLEGLLEERGVEEPNTFDATVLEFNFTTKGGDLFFNFVFASDEYNEFTNSIYNDVFGFFLDGRNIALIPGTDTPVAINNVNGGNPLGTEVSNPHLFNNNDLDDGGPFFDIEYDGFTEVFTAKALGVGMGTHTIKLAIADTSDHVLDSAVFLEAGSFSDRPIFGPPIYVGEGCVVPWWDPNDPTDPWDPNGHNLNEDPNFVRGYYLSYVAAGQDSNSPCIDVGSGLAVDMGFDQLTTRIDGVNDVNFVDLGYHYPEGFPRYELTVTIIEDPCDPGIHGTVDPNSGMFYEGAVVPLIADPCDGYRVKEWSGTDDDLSIEPNSTVTMTEDKDVTVEFEVHHTYLLTTAVDGGNGSIVPHYPSPGAPYLDGTVVYLQAIPDDPGTYEVKKWTGTDNDLTREPNNTVTINGSNASVTVEFGLIGYHDITINGDVNNLFDTIQEAIDAAEPNDEVIVGDGVYTGPGNRDLHFNMGIPIAVRSQFGPENCIINCEGAGRGFILDVNEDPNYIVQGFTITGGDAEFGGGIYCNGSGATVTNCRIIDNTSSFDGGGIYCTGGAAMIVTNTEISHNSAGRFGGGVYSEDESTPAFINCLVTYNESGDIGGSFYLYGSSAIIGLCTIAHNTGLDYGDLDDDDRPYGPKGGICSREASPEITNCILWDNGDDLYGGEGESVSVTYCCIEDLTDSTEDEGDGNLGVDPLFIGGGLSYLYGDYYLLQEHWDPAENSPCVDTGEQYALIDFRVEYNLGDITTSVENLPDTAYTDMGFHYPYYTGPPIQYSLEITVTGDGTVTPAPGVYYHSPGDVVGLTAHADDPSEYWGYWSGTDDDTSFNTWNSVTMCGGNKTVSVEFKPIGRNTIYVPDEYPLLQDAIDYAEYGDIIILAPIQDANEPYRTSYGFLIQNNKAITITSIDPADPCVVAATVIEMESPVEEPDAGVGNAFTFYNVGRNTILDGITIRGFIYTAVDGDPGEETLQPGENGSSTFGGGITCIMASPTIRNCQIVNCQITGGDGGEGMPGVDDGVVEHLDGRPGGWPGGAYGGGMACLINSDPCVVNCTFDNCAATGGSGGDGGAGNTDPDGWGGRGGGWFYGQNSHWYKVPWLYSYIYDEWWWWERGDGSQSFYDDYTKYTGLGGAVYVGRGCSPTFIGCTFTNNRSEGGLCGICGVDGFGDWRQEPGLRWKIDNFGGAVYCDSDSVVTFTNCTFSGNLADPNRPIFDPNEPEGPENYANDDSVVGFGGGVAFKYNADVTFQDCNFVENVGCEGGGVYWAWSESLISDCNFVGNSAGSGGGVLFVGGSPEIARSNFSGNEATALFARGGAICSLGANPVIADCSISNNEAVGSGGGIYVSSKDIGGNGISDGDMVLVENCLITGNIAGVSGGGISANWYSDPEITNCTIADNTVTEGYGGGLYSSYGNYSNVINSILWNNYADFGRQIAVRIDTNPSTVDVSYSDVQGRQSAAYVDANCILIWDASSNIYDDPNFAIGPLGNYYLSQIAAGQLVDSPCVDAGSDYASHLGMHRYTTRTDEVFDGDIVDMGYHYPLAYMVELCSLCDLSGNGIIDFADFAILSLHWLNDDCSVGNDWCGGADLTFDTHVDSEDLGLFVGCWLAKDANAPIPNPSEWKIEPYSVSATPPYSISMIAKSAFDGWGGEVEYYFECVYGNGSDWGWDPNTKYIDDGLGAGLEPNAEYGYRVRARDATGNETDWSVVGYAIAGEEAGEPDDYNAPTGLMWVTAPYATSPNSIEMEASATDPEDNGVVYEFWNITLDYYSEWLSSPTWTDTGLDPNTEYCYRVRARDESANHNTTEWLDPNCATTPEEGGEPPGPPPAPNILDYNQRAEPLGGDKYDWYHWLMVSRSAEDATGVDEFRFVCLSVSVFSSDWAVIDGEGIIGDEVGEPGYPDYTVTYDGDTITYDRLVKVNSSFGETYNWRVDSRNAYGETQSGTVMIPPP